jgi:hypothetical protein
VRFAVLLQFSSYSTALYIRLFCLLEHGPKSYRLIANGLEQPHGIGMGANRFHVGSQKAFLLFTGWLTHLEVGPRKPGRFPSLFARKDRSFRDENQPGRGDYTSGRNVKRSGRRNIRKVSNMEQICGRLCG